MLLFDCFRNAVVRLQRVMSPVSSARFYYRLHLVTYAK
jgi:hypothetical protein